MNDKISYDPRDNPLKTPWALNTKLEEAVRHHQQGRLEHARHLYESILKANPQQADAWHLLGVMSLQAKDYPKAHELIAEAIRLSPESAEFYYNHGLVFDAEGRHQEALDCFNHAIEHNPQYVEAYFQRGMSYAKQGLLKEAVASLDHATEIKPDFIDAYYQAAFICRNAGDLESAVMKFNKVLALKKDSPETLVNLGYTLKLQQKFEKAIECYDQALKLCPNDAMIYNMRGVVQVDLKEYSKAVKDYHHAIAIDPNFAEAYNNLGIVLFEMGDIDASLEAFGRSIHLKIDFIEPYINLAMAFQKIGKFDAAIRYFDKGLHERPNMSALHLLKGLCLYKMTHFSQSIACFDKAIELEPRNPVAYNNRGAAYYELARFDDAMANYQKSLSLHENYGDAKCNLAFLRLLQGDLQQGLSLYEWRWLREDQLGKQPQFDAPEWTGKELLSGKTILVYSEQGLGDALHMCRYVRQLIAADANVIFRVDSRLKKLMTTLSDKNLSVVSQDDTVPRIDFQIALMSLPFRFDACFENLLNYPAYLSSNLKSRSYWELTLGVKSKKRIGIAWTSHPISLVEKKRNINLAEFLTAFSDRVELISLQKEISDEDAALLAQHSVKHFGDKLRDFSDTAALCDAMDLIISVDTSVAHLAAALGKPTWILLPFVPDWRWFLQREDSPWYPSVKLFRQEKRDDWSSVLTKLLGLVEML